MTMLLVGTPSTVSSKGLFSDVLEKRASPQFSKNYFTYFGDVLNLYLRLH